MDDAKEGEHKPIVLLVDDSGVQRLRLKGILQQGGDVGVIEAEDGFDALRQAKMLRPDLVITDLEMPKLNGLALTKALRTDASFAHMPIVMMTSHDEKEFRLNAFHIGVDDFITKPGDPEEVLARVTSLLRLRQAMVLVEQKNQELQNAMDQLHQGHKRAVAAQRLAYAGHLAAGMAHECNNPLAMLRANLGTIIDYAKDMAEVLPDDVKESDEIQEILDDLPDVAQEAEAAAERLKKVIGNFSSLQDEKATQEADTVVVPVAPMVRNVANATREAFPSVTLLVDERMSDDVQVRAAPAEFERYMVSLLSYMQQTLSELDDANVLMLRVDADAAQVQVCIDAPELSWSPDEAEEQFSRWLVSKDGRVSFDVSLGSAREGLLAMGALVDHLAIYGGGWSLVVTFEREPDVSLDDEAGAPTPAPAAVQ